MTVMTTYERWVPEYASMLVAARCGNVFAVELVPKEEWEAMESKDKAALSNRCIAALAYGDERCT